MLPEPRRSSEWRARPRDVVKTGRPLIDLLAENKEISKHADRKKLERLVDPANYLGVAGEMVDRVLKMRK